MHRICIFDFSLYNNYKYLIYFHFGALEIKTIVSFICVSTDQKLLIQKMNRNFNVGYFNFLFVFQIYILNIFLYIIYYFN